jgi:hypothetical protein
LATRLEELGDAQERARTAVEDDADRFVAFDRLFAAVALVNPRHTADKLRNLAADPGVHGRSL